MPKIFLLKTHCPPGVMCHLKARLRSFYRVEIAAKHIVGNLPYNRYNGWNTLELPVLRQGRNSIVRLDRPIEARPKGPSDNQFAGLLRNVSWHWAQRICAASKGGFWTHQMCARNFVPFSTKRNLPAPATTKNTYLAAGGNRDRARMHYSAISGPTSDAFVGNARLRSTPTESASAARTTSWPRALIPPSRRASRRPAFP